jgi:hypothetical protein
MQPYPLGLNLNRCSVLHINCNLQYANGFFQGKFYSEFGRTVSATHSTKPVLAVMARKPKQHSAWWKGMFFPPLKDVSQVRLKHKRILDTIFDCEGILHQMYVPSDHIVNQHYYWEVSWHLDGASPLKMSEMVVHPWLVCRPWMYASAYGIVSEAVLGC